MTMAFPGAHNIISDAHCCRIRGAKVKTLANPLSRLFLQGVKVLRPDSTREVNFEADRDVSSDAKCLPAAPRGSLQFARERLLFATHSAWRMASNVQYAATRQLNATGGCHQVQPTR